jgi:hypothetical protein
MIILLDGSMSFCTKCGHEIPAGATFCSNCGRPVTLVAAAPPAESTLFATEGYKSGMFGQSRHLLFFTDRRLIVAPVPGGGTSPNVLAGLAQKAGDAKTRQLREKKIEELLLDKKNYAIPYGEMTRIEVTKTRLGGGFINISWVGGTEKFIGGAEIKKSIDDFERLLKPVLGDRLTVKTVMIR